MKKRPQNSKKLGRHEEIAEDELVRRYAAMKQVLEDNWGLLGLRLPRVRKPEDVRSILDLIHGVEWCSAFRDFPTGCLLRQGDTKVGWRQVRDTREKLKKAKRVRSELSGETQTAYEKLQPVKNAFEAARKGKEQHQLSKDERDELQKLAKLLRIEETTRHYQELSDLLQVAQKEQESLEQQLSMEEAWLSRNEVLAFVRDPERRYSKTPENFAKAMAGLPFYDWLYSLRKCLSIRAAANVRKTYLFQLFEMIQGIVRRTRSGNLKKIESRLKSDLLKTECDPLLRSYISPQWFYMARAFEDCRGKKFRRAHIPYKVMGSFLEHRQKPTLADSALAKLNQLSPQDL